MTFDGFSVNRCLLRIDDISNKSKHKVKNIYASDER